MIVRFSPPTRAHELVLSALLVLTACAPTVLAQTTGKVIGTVRDVDTGQPLVGAQVVVEGTNLGNVTNRDGFYFVNHVPVGVQRITAQYLGYQTTSREQRVLAGQTMTVDFALSGQVVRAEGVVAVIEREPVLARDNTISKSRFTGEEARALPVDRLQDVITLGAGIYEESGGFVVRGGRVTESATFVDGVLITDFSDQVDLTRISAFSVEEVDVITGGFNAEFGHAQSGIINIVTREGGRALHGTLRVTTDELEVEQSFGYSDVQASLGGPIVTDRLNFFVSGEITGAEDFAPRAAGFNPAVGEFNSSGSTEALLPGNRGDDTRFQGKLTAFLPANARLTATYLFSRDQRENFQRTRTTFQHLSSTATRTKSHDAIVGYDQQIFQTVERSLNLQVRGNYAWRTSHRGTPKSPATAAVLDRVFGDACGAACDASEEAFEADFLGWRFDDVEFFFEDSTTGSIDRALTTRSDIPDPVFGQPNLWVQDGFANVFFHTHERRYGVRVDLDAQLDRVHRAKVGIEHTWVNLANRDSRFTDHRFADVFDVDPRVAAIYAQDRLDFGDLVIDLGLRWDRFDPNVSFPEFPGVVSCEISPFRLPDGSVDTTLCREDAGVRVAEPKSELAPRIGVAHPITDRTQVRLSYGRFHQLPQMLHFFAGFLTDARQGGATRIYGNPGLEHVETTAFEAGITHRVSENVVLDLVAYNRDRRGAIRREFFQTQEIDPTVGERQVFINGDHGNVKGFDFTLTKRFADYWSTELAWSLQWARGTASSPTGFAGGIFGNRFDPDNPGVVLDVPLKIIPELFDRLHNVDWQVSLRLPDDFREGTPLGGILRNVSLWATYSARSGSPFTRIDPQTGNALEDLSGSRMPWIHAGDVRVTKGFRLGGGLDLEVFGLVRNVLDVKNVTSVNLTTGLPDRTGLEDRLSRTPVIPNSLRLPGSETTLPVFLPMFDDAGAEVARQPGDFPVAVSDIRPEFRDLLALQDLDGDGTITLEEARESLRRALVAAGTGGQGDSPLNYGAPRQIRFGVQLRF